MTTYIIRSYGTDTRIIAKTAMAAANRYVAGDKSDTETTFHEVAVAKWDRRGAKPAPEDFAYVHVVAQPSAPKCDRKAHAWEQGSVYGSGGGAAYRSVCRHCGCTRHTDTSAVSPATGTRGHLYVRYEAA